MAEELRKSLKPGVFKDQVTAQTNKFHGMRIGRSTAPGPSNTPSQAAWRDRYATCVTQWNALTPEEKAAYQEDADKRRITSFNQFMSECLLKPGEATFGYEVAGGNGIEIAYVDPTRYSTTMRGTSYYPVFSGVLTEIWAYIRMPYGEGSNYILELGIYEEDGWGLHSHKFIEKEKEKNLTTSGWHRVYNFHESLTAGKNYILVAIADFPYVPPTPVQIDLAYDDIGTNKYYERSGLLRRWPDPWDKAPEGLGRNYSIYAGYSIE